MSEKSYLQTRLDELGITDKLNTTKLTYDKHDDAGSTCETETQIFTSDKFDNIEILYYDIFGNAIEYPAPETEQKDYYNRYIEYRRKRWKEPEKHDNNKYYVANRAALFAVFPAAYCQSICQKTKNNHFVHHRGRI